MKPAELLKISFCHGRHLSLDQWRRHRRVGMVRYKTLKAMSFWNTPPKTNMETKDRCRWKGTSFFEASSGTGNYGILCQFLNMNRPVSCKKPGSARQLDIFLTGPLNHSMANPSKANPGEKGSFSNTDGEQRCPRYKGLLKFVGNFNNFSAIQWGES